MASSIKLIPGRSICVGTRSSGLGDALLTTTLPARLRNQFPSLRITTSACGFNAAVFKGNPNVRGVQLRAPELLGDEILLESGHLIRLREKKLGLSDMSSHEPRPEIYLTDSERAWARRFYDSHLLPENRGKPVCILHPWKPREKARRKPKRAEVAPVAIWDELVAKWRAKVRFWQVGIEYDSAVQGCEYYFFPSPRRHSQARRLFALMEAADGFLGVCSGPMHVAQAFGLPATVILDPRTPDERLDHQPTGLYPSQAKMFMTEGLGKLDPFLSSLKPGIGQEKTAAIASSAKTGNINTPCQHRLSGP